ncbi:Type II/IV secretion system secretin RcpA/CpaC [Caenispirillum salinarum AK4]|uniref:Type II/IV secretion system secretin RcpA/CpaC n=1 Tax=Caenispirillum salinarum AK4 TaxID=1238182 RepID=K9HQL7_9PROT|nr:type II and III secretion system protein family protein [Caenispirillum salinarum]EKV30691.1 Type II/IV secretion system secretin RcpA/CpaC [Caenispirillum salinarum AK4]
MTHRMRHLGAVFTAMVFLAATPAAGQEDEATPAAPAPAGAAADPAATPVPVTRRPDAPATPVDTARTYAVKVGQSVALELPRPISDVVVADPETADVVVQQPTKVFVLGREPGTTNMFFVDDTGEVILNARVLVAPDVAAVREALRDLQPASAIDIKTVNESILMSGVVQSAADAADAEAVVQAFMGADTSVINALRIAGDQQVLLQVTVAEISRTTLKSLGVETSVDVGNQTLQTVTSFARDVTGGVFGQLAVDAGIDSIAFSALEREGLAKILAEPALTAISGETANFLVGGEFPLPTGADRDDEGNVEVTVELREFGVSLSFTPVVLANDQINLRIATEVSNITEENAIDLAGVRIRGLSVRRADSTVMLPSGGSLMIAGLIQNDEFNRVEGIPGLMDMPILGALFRSNQFQTNRTELVVAVKAFLVRPIEFGPRMAYPTDGFVPANDLDIYLYGRLRSTYGPKDGEPAGEPYVIAGPSGYMMR